MWKQKHKSEHGTCDKKILTPPSIRICPLFDELKKGDFFLPPSLLYGPMSPSQQFFFECIPNDNNNRYWMSSWVLLCHGRHVADEAAGGGQDERPGMFSGAGVNLPNSQSDYAREYQQGL